MALAVTDNPAKSRYELRDDGHLLGFTEYDERDDGVLVFPHTIITEPKRGAGYGATLVQGALDACGRRGARSWRNARSSRPSSTSTRTTRTCCA